MLKHPSILFSSTFVTLLCSLLFSRENAIYFGSALIFPKPSVSNRSRQLNNSAKTRPPGSLPFLQSPQKETRISFFRKSSENENDENTSTKKKSFSAFFTSTRRNWIVQSTSSAGAIASILSSRPNSCIAATSTENDALLKQAALSSSNASCDPTVSIMQRGTRKLYLLGTAHISAESAQLAGQLVRQVRPNAVFVELDAKRIGRVTKKEDSLDGTSSSTPTVPIGSSNSDNSSLENSISTDSRVDARERVEATSPKKVNPFNLKARVMQASQALIGDAIKTLYQKLESQGFSAGEEFTIAIREGLSQNATIILGDRDVDITLRRLSEAFAKTDIQKLLSADSEFEKNMQAYLPDTLKDSNGKVPIDDSAMDAATLSSFVEAMKTKDNVKNIMRDLKKAAPELYEALVGERDLFMAEGMDRLAQFETMVSVMGLAHLDGVERNLMQWGWKTVNPMC